MGDPSVLREDRGVQQGDEATRAATDFDALRALLLHPEQRDLAALKTRLDDARARAEDLGEVLPQVLLQHAQDPHFTRALTPPIEKAITASVQRNPKPLADALFPVMGPAIRKAVSAGLAGMVESLNRTLEHSLSWRSLQWRLEGWRTGKSFAEVVLAKTLVYRVEQVFLIDRKTGLLLQHVHDADATVQDADMVSGMLTAIRDFVQDSFHVAAGDSLDSLKVGDLSVWIEPGPFATVAAVLRGTAPREYRRTLQDAVESLHLQFGEALETFDGDTSVFDDARSTLETCLETRYRADERKPRTRGAWIMLGAALIALTLLVGWQVGVRQRRAHYLDILRAEPGLVVVTSSSSLGRLVIAGLRDPLARDPQALLADAGLTATEVESRWSPYFALDPALVLRRATAALRPPAGVSLTLDGDVLAATGDVTPAWTTEAARLAPLLPGVTRFDSSRTLAPALQAATAAVAAHAVLFAKGSADLVADQPAALAALVADVRHLGALAAASGTRLALDVIGHTDADGPDEANLSLSLARAQVVATAIAAADPANLDVAPRGVGSADPADPDGNEVSKLKNRRVIVRLTPAAPR